MYFDFDIFRAVAEKAFREEFNRDVEACAEMFETMMNIFHYFFNSYREKYGKDHPHLKKEQIRRIMRTMVSDYAYTFGESEDYKEVIDAYFRKSYQRGCDHHINHFFSGMVIDIINYEMMY